MIPTESLIQALATGLITAAVTAPFLILYFWIGGKITYRVIKNEAKKDLEKALNISFKDNPTAYETMKTVAATFIEDILKELTEKAKNKKPPPKKAT